ncbi:MAG: tetratricopeptide repeat protein [Planctomycetota bacterium]
MEDWVRAERHAEAARMFAERGRWAWALRHLDRAIAFDPDRGAWHADRGVALDALGRHDEAVDAYRQSVDLDEETSGLRLRLGTTLLRLGRFDEAEAELRRSASLEPTAVEPWVELLTLYTHTQDDDARDEAFYTAQAIDDASAELYDVMGQSLAAAGDLSRAVLCWQEVLKRDARHPDARLRMARASWQSGQTRRAHRLYTQQLNLNPTDAEALLELGGLLTETGKLGEARSTLQSLVELEPDHADAHAILAEIALTQGHADAADRRLRRVLKLDPDRPSAYLGLAKAALLAGNQDEAREHLKVELARIAVGSPESVSLARMALRLDMSDAATRLLAPWKGRWDLEAPDGQAADAALLFGVTRLLADDPAAGIAACRASYTLDPTSSVPLCNIALAYRHAGRHARARATLRRAMRDHPDDARVASLRRRLRFARLRDALGALIGRKPADV